MNVFGVDMSLKKELIEALIVVEGGYVNDPSDSGGETNFGVTIAVARKYGFKGLMVNMTHDDAFEIYANRYWHKLRCDDIAELSPRIANEIFDTGVNMGTGRAAKFLQRCLNVFNNRQSHYPDIAVDGGIGNQTVATLEKYLTCRKESVMLKALNSLQGAKYISLAETREKDEKHAHGWFDHRVEV